MINSWIAAANNSNRSIVWLFFAQIKTRVSNFARNKEAAIKLQGFEVSRVSLEVFNLQVVIGENQREPKKSFRLEYTRNFS